jgi:Ca-activated chloride channel family protein
MKAAVVAVLLASASTGAWTGHQVFSARIVSVRLDVLVTEGRQPVLGLGPQDFEILDNGVPQRIDLLTFETLPLNVALALDMSGSVTGSRLAHLREAARAVVEALQGDDKIAVITFDRYVVLRAPMSGDRNRALSALDQPTAGGNTALVDATLSALVASESDTGRALAIVFSDGTDTASFLQPDAVIAAARRSEAVLYAASVSSPGRTNFLRDLAATTGGRAIDIESTRDLRAVFLRILDEFRQRYLMSFTPQGVARDGWHRLEVRLKARRATVNARSGYQSGGR